MKDKNRMTAVAATTTEPRKAEQWSLALSAANIPHDILADKPHELLVLVNPHQLETARDELAGFEQEDINWPPPEPEAKSGPVDITRNPPTVLIMGGLLLFYLITGPWVDSSIWFTQGMVAGDRILQYHEWWRLITGLTLHADPVHLLGNVLIGGFLIHFLCRTLGTGFGWILILITGGIGNGINVMMHDIGHRSIGFSTAVFGTIGLLTGLRCARRKGVTRDVVLPLAAGAGLLAMLGSSGEHTDLGAHLFGLLTGIILGTMLGLIPGFPRRFSTPWLQNGCLLAAILTVLLCWRFALTA